MSRLSKSASRRLRRKKAQEARKRSAKKANLTGLTIGEISAVDNPAQEGALALLMKVAPSETHPLLKGEFADQLHQIQVGDRVMQILDGMWELNRALRESLEQALEEDLANAEDAAKAILADYSAAVVELVKDNTDDILAAIDDGPDGDDTTKNASGSAPHGKEKQMTGKTKDGAPADVDALKKQHADDIAAKDAEIATLKAENALSAVEKSHYDTLAGEAKQAFLKMSTDERSAAITKSQGDDPVVYTTAEGVELRKSDGRAAISLAKQLDNERKARLEETEKRKEETAKRERVELEKRAETELAHLPGSTGAKVQLLKSALAIKDETERKEALAMLKANDAGLSRGHAAVGVAKGAAESNGPEEELTKLAKSYQKDNDGVTFAKAYDAVISTPEGRELYRQSQQQGQQVQ